MAQIKPSSITGLNEEYEIVQIFIDVFKHQNVEVVISHTFLNASNKPEQEFIRMHLDAQGKMLTADQLWGITITPKSIVSVSGSTLVISGQITEAQTKFRLCQLGSMQYLVKSITYDSVTNTSNLILDTQDDLSAHTEMVYPAYAASKPTTFDWTDSSTWGNLQYIEIPTINSDTSKLMYAMQLNNLYEVIKDACYKLAHMLNIMPPVSQGWTIQ
jgi:hypothetical protein